MEPRRKGTKASQGGQVDNESTDHRRDVIFNASLSKVFHVPLPSPLLEVKRATGLRRGLKGTAKGTKPPSQISCRSGLPTLWAKAENERANALARGGKPLRDE